MTGGRGRRGPQIASEQTYAELLTPQQRRQLLAMHRAVARDRRVPKADREQAAARAKALERLAHRGH